ncbi:(2Fe-2S)-binding protein [Streptomyces sp. TLI_171]|uniref:(2Fe-2S)-binding protein n=1 Tax=Streptomyces sp. TLI_171 TaxID=1938859 RepID=UPI000C679F73|nr:(2Fe-2S)-binding protein [Streptomyces sp. TLI_171]RKE18765.1 FhuF-like iron-sulfur protein [Streptomyces sp. TLI_171]
MLHLPSGRARTVGETAETYRQLGRICPVLTVSLVDAAPVDGQEWVSADRLASAVERLIDAEAARIHRRHGVTPRPHVAASRLLHHYLWTNSLLLSGIWYLERRIPVLPARHLWIAAGTGDFALRPGDWALGDEAALRDAVAAHLGPVLAAFQPHVRRGPRALWGMATDDLVSGLWYLGRMLDQEDRAVAVATALLDTGAPPWTGPAGFRRENHTWTRTRQGCCLYYAVDPANPCGTCPRRTPAARPTGTPAGAPRRAAT